jgi:hypothetical protein
MICTTLARVLPRSTSAGPRDESAVSERRLNRLAELLTKAVDRIRTGAPLANAVPILSTPSNLAGGRIGRYPNTRFRTGATRRLSLRSVLIGASRGKRLRQSAVAAHLMLSNGAND